MGNLCSFVRRAQAQMVEYYATIRSEGGMEQRWDPSATR
jgi:hypothetical protein